jgi:hypothetical protein
MPNKEQTDPVQRRMMSALGRSILAEKCTQSVWEYQAKNSYLRSATRKVERGTELFAKGSDVPMYPKPQQFHLAPRIPPVDQQEITTQRLRDIINSYCQRMVEMENRWFIDEALRVAGDPQPIPDSAPALTYAEFTFMNEDINPKLLLLHPRSYRLLQVSNISFRPVCSTDLKVHPDVPEGLLIAVGERHQWQSGLYPLTIDAVHTDYLPFRFRFVENKVGVEMQGTEILGLALDKKYVRVLKLAV